MLMAAMSARRMTEDVVAGRHVEVAEQCGQFLRVVALQGGAKVGHGVQQREDLVRGCRRLGVTPLLTFQWTARPEQPFSPVLTPLMIRSGEALPVAPDAYAVTLLGLPLLQT
jgi:hypothetical protein